MFEQKITDDKIVEWLEHDDINRNNDLLSMLKILDNSEGNVLYSLNGNWGSGKTIFLRKLVMLVNRCHFLKHNYATDKSIFKLSDDKRTKLDEMIKSKYSIFNEMIDKSDIDCVYFNAWEHDDEEDPILSILYDLINNYKLINAIDVANSSKLTTAICTIIKNIEYKKIKNIDLKGLIKEFNFDEELVRKERIKEAVTEILNELISENCNKLIIFVDELDRCNPNYVVKMLERLKHYFNDERIIMVVSTNLVELSNLISSFYGNNESAIQYLDKIIDFKLELPVKKVDNYLLTIPIFSDERNIEDLLYVMKRIIETNNFEYRMINRYAALMSFFVRNIRVNNANSGYKKHIFFMNNVMIPYAVGLSIQNYNSYINFSNGKGWNEFRNFLESDNVIESLAKKFFEGDITDKETMNNFDCYKELEIIYKNLFSNKKKDIKTQLGNYHYNDLINEKEKLSILGSLSDFGSLKD